MKSAHGVLRTRLSSGDSIVSTLIMLFAPWINANSSSVNPPVGLQQEASTPDATTAAPMVVYDNFLKYIDLRVCRWGKIEAAEKAI